MEIERPFFKLLSTVRHEVDSRLQILFEEEERIAESYGLDTRAMLHAVRDLTLRGGKRARPALVVVGYLAVSNSRLSSMDAVYNVGVALELLQSYFLIHDDWMDDDEVRRGGPSVHILLRRHHGADRLGDISAILAGDHACALAQRALLDGLHEHPHAVTVASTFAKIQRDVILGQILDVVGREEDIERMHDLKTNSYTIQGPLELGAQLAGAPATTLDTLRRFAKPIGIAFQLCDDLLSAFGSEETTGKPRGNDLRSGKRTSVLMEAERLLPPQDLLLLNGVKNNPNANWEEIEAVLRSFEQHGVRSAVEARRDTLLQQAEAILEVSELNERHLLQDAARTLVVRHA